MQRPKRPAWSSTTPAAFAKRPRKKFSRAWDSSIPSNGLKDPTGKIIGVLGCVAQQEGEGDLRARALGEPGVRLGKLPQAARAARGARGGDRRVTGLDTDTDETFETEMTRRDNPFRAYLTIIEGCDKACSYCVVPFTRGPERSRASASVLQEVRKLADAGYTEIQLLGQTVNSYRDPSPGRMSFAELLLAVAACRGFGACASRLRTRAISARTSSPPSMPSRHCATTCICPCSRARRAFCGAMQRTYTREEYLEKIAMIRERAASDQRHLRHHRGLSGRDRERLRGNA